MEPDSSLSCSQMSSIVTKNHLKMGAESAPETSCIAYINPTMDNVQHNIRTMNQTVTQTFREPLGRQPFSSDAGAGLLGCNAVWTCR
jgi:hypothetical protein